MRLRRLTGVCSSAVSVEPGDTPSAANDMGDRAARAVSDFRISCRLVSSFLSASLRQQEVRAPELWQPLTGYAGQPKSLTWRVLGWLPVTEFPTILTRMQSLERLYPASAVGSWIMQHVPEVMLESKAILPPQRSTTSFAMERPRPVPFWRPPGGFEPV